MRYYDEGWNARVRGEAYAPNADLAWRDGWKDCDTAPVEHQRPFNELLTSEPDEGHEPS